MILRRLKIKDWQLSPKDKEYFGHKIQRNQIDQALKTVKNDPDGKKRDYRLIITDEGKECYILAANCVYAKIHGTLYQSPIGLKTFPINPDSEYNNQELRNRNWRIWNPRRDAFWDEHEHEGCAICGADLKPFRNRKQVAHLKKPRTDEEYLTVNEDTCRCLCRTCHFIETFSIFENDDFEEVKQAIKEFNA